MKKNTENIKISLIFTFNICLILGRSNISKIRGIEKILDLVLVSDHAIKAKIIDIIQNIIFLLCFFKYRKQINEKIPNKKLIFA